MQVLQETTVWDKVEYTVPNHTYLVNDGGKVVAYRKASGEINVFSKPLSFSKSHRKFKKVVDKELERAYTVYNS